MDTVPEEAYNCLMAHAASGAERGGWGEDLPAEKREKLAALADTNTIEKIASDKFTVVYVDEVWRANTRTFF